MCDVSKESDAVRFRDEVIEQHQIDHVSLLFNNAGLSGGGSMTTDLRCNAPHVKVSVVMPGHIGTSIVENSLRFGVHQELTAEETDMMMLVSKEFEEQAPMSAAEAATVILDGVRSEKWRILVGDGARLIDAAVRSDPEAAYDGEGFFEVMNQISARYAD